jgi:hypothetical protein
MLNETEKVEIQEGFVYLTLRLYYDLKTYWGAEV